MPSGINQQQPGTQVQQQRLDSLRFPDGFHWGVATAAYQIEGSPDADGKGKSIWDTYAHLPGKMKNNDTGDVAIDHYRRYKGDVALIKEIGVTAYRFSISWPRIFPEGTGKPNPRGLDFYSRLVNIYVPKMYVIASDQDSGYRQVPFNISHPRMFSSWHTFSPEVLYWGPRLVNSIWQPREIYITENGCGASDAVADDGNVYDTDRVMYLRNVMAQLQRAIAEGVPVKGNFVWSAMDNLEWTDGYGRRFGIVYVDFETQQRIPKLSAAWYKEAASRNAVV